MLSWPPFRFPPVNLWVLPSLGIDDEYFRGDTRDKEAHAQRKMDTRIREAHRIREEIIKSGSSLRSKKEGPCTSGGKK